MPLGCEGGAAAHRRPRGRVGTMAVGETLCWVKGVSDSYRAGQAVLS